MYELFVCLHLELLARFGPLRIQGGWGGGGGSDVCDLIRTNGLDSKGLTVRLATA